MSIEAKTALGHVRQLLNDPTNPLGRFSTMVQHALTGSWTAMVRGFHVMYDVPVANPEDIHADMSHVADDRKLFRLTILAEEFMELCEGMGYVMKTQGSKVVFFRLEGEGDVVEVADGIGDMIFVLIGFAVEFGIDIDRVFREISASNFTKLAADGEVIRRDDGKILKGPNYMKPALARIVMAASQPLLTEGDSTDA